MGEAINTMNSRLDRIFYRQDAYALAQALLGKVLVTNFQGKVKRFRIVETEAYGGATDKAAHSYNNRRTKRTETMFGEAGHLYIYLIYGMYYLMNIVANKPEIPEGVLIRSLEPLDGEASTNGPGKLCRALGINSSHNGLDLCASSEIYLYDDNYQIQKLVACKRVGIDYAEEDKNRLWRFYLEESNYVSRKIE
jgi:DNA-3-methyladenine glycosylase